MAVTEAEIMELISQLTQRGDVRNLPFTLQELANILEGDGAPAKIVSLVRDLSGVSKEAAELRQYKDLTPEQIETAVKRGRERLKREEEERRRSHC